MFSGFCANGLKHLFIQEIREVVVLVSKTLHLARQLLSHFPLFLLYDFLQGIVIYHSETDMEFEKVLPFHCNNVKPLIKFLSIL